MNAVDNNSTLSLEKVLKQLRTAKGLSQRELAERIDMDQTYISHLEHGRRDPSVRTLRRIAHAVDVPVSTLLVMALWSDLEEHERLAFRPILEGLMDLAKAVANGEE